MSAATILQFALQLLPLVTSGVDQFIAWLQTLRTAAQQTGEWTAEQDFAFTAALYAKTNDPAYLPDVQYSTKPVFSAVEAAVAPSEPVPPAAAPTAPA